MRVICVAGVRPNYMKVKLVMDALEELEARVLLVDTGLRCDSAISDVFFADLSIRRPDHFLGAGSGTHAVQTCHMTTAFEPLAADLAPDVVVVVGDVNSTLACAPLAAKLVLPAHPRTYGRMRGAALTEGVRIIPRRLPRLHRAGGLGAAGAHRFRRRPGGDRCAGRLLPDAEGNTERPSP